MDHLEKVLASCLHKDFVDKVLPHLQDLAAPVFYNFIEGNFITFDSYPSAFIDKLRQILSRSKQVKEKFLCNLMTNFWIRRKLIICDKIL